MEEGWLWEGISRLFSPKLLLRAGSPRAGHAVYTQVLNISKDCDSVTSMGNLVQSPLQLRSLFYFYIDFLVFHCVPTDSCLFMGHYWKESGTVSFTSPHQVFIDLHKILLSLLFSRPNSPSSLSLSLYYRCSSGLVTFVALHWTNSSMSMSFLCWEAQKRTQHSRCVSAVLSRGEGSPFSISWWCSSSCSLVRMLAFFIARALC